MNEKESYKVHFSNLVGKSPLFFSLPRIFKGDFFLTLIGTIVAVTSLLQVDEVRCLAGLRAEQKCENLVIILKFFSFFSFLTIFVSSFFVLIFLFEIFHIMFLAAISKNKLKIRFYFKNLVNYLKRKFIHITKKHKVARYCFATLIDFFVFIIPGVNNGFHRVFIIFYYTSIIWFSFVGSLLKAASMTPQLTKIFEYLLQAFSLTF
jgi:hypothetical protein